MASNYIYIPSYTTSSTISVGTNYIYRNFKYFKAKDFQLFKPRAEAGQLFPENLRPIFKGEQFGANVVVRGPYATESLDKDGKIEKFLIMLNIAEENPRLEAYPIAEKCDCQETRDYRKHHVSDKNENWYHVSDLLKRSTPYFEDQIFHPFLNERELSSNYYFLSTKLRTIFGYELFFLLKAACPEVITASSKRQGSFDFVKIDKVSGTLQQELEEKTKSINVINDKIKLLEEELSALRKEKEKVANSFSHIIDAVSIKDAELIFAKQNLDYKTTQQQNKQKTKNKTKKKKAVEEQVGE